MGKKAKYPNSTRFGFIFRFFFIYFLSLVLPGIIFFLVRTGVRVPLYCIGLATKKREVKKIILLLLYRTLLMLILNSIVFITSNYYK